MITRTPVTVWTVGLPEAQPAEAVLSAPDEEDGDKGHHVQESKLLLGKGLIPVRHEGGHGHGDDHRDGGQPRPDAQQYQRCTDHLGDVSQWLVDADFKVRAAKASLANGGSELRVRDTLKTPRRALITASLEENVRPFGFTLDILTSPLNSAPLPMPSLFGLSTANIRPPWQMNRMPTRWWRFRLPAA